MPSVPAVGALEVESSPLPQLPPQANEGDEDTDTDTDEEPLRPTVSAASASPGVRVERGEELQL